jgi:group II intron reverse transcriptase/maturase
MRKLGIPTVLDRFIQQALLQVLQPMLDPDFSRHSHGFRPGHRAHDAIVEAQRYIQDGRRWVVDVDLEQFFDRVNHDVLMGRLAKRIGDRCVLGLIRRYLGAGVLANGLATERHEGTPQGGPLSPLLANVLLDEVDKELEKREHTFVRYADDCNVYVRSRRAGERVMGTAPAALRKAPTPRQRDEERGRPGDEAEDSGLLFLGSRGTDREASGSGQSPRDDEGAGPFHHEADPEGGASNRSAISCGDTCSAGGRSTSGWRIRRASSLTWMNGSATVSEPST